MNPHLLPPLDIASAPLPLWAVVAALSLAALTALLSLLVQSL